MDIQIKKYADTGDLKSLKYIFVDALDVDPTFVRYEEEYNYCKAIPGLLEPHIELTPFVQDKTRWNESYWTSLKTDLIKNFSDRRMMHMKEVAQIFLAEKVERIQTERSATHLPPVTSPVVTERKADNSQPIAQKNSTISKAEQEQKKKEEAIRKLAEDERRAEEKRQAEAKARQAETQRKLAQSLVNEQSTGEFSKKAIGIAIAAIAVTAIVLILILK